MNKNKIHMYLWKSIADIISEYKPYNIEHYIITVNNITLSNDISNMTVYISSMPKNNDVILAFYPMTNKYRYLLGQKVKLRRIPRLKFEYV